MKEQTDAQTKVPCVLQDFIPFGATAQKAARHMAPMMVFPGFWTSRMGFKPLIWDLNLEVMGRWDMSPMA